VSGWRAAAVVALAIASEACAPLRGPVCATGQQQAVQDTLYFGTAKPNGSVGADEWKRFLEETVTPRFPQGLTVSQAAGQWRGADGAIVREAAYVLQLVHPGEAAQDSAVADITAAYKRQFEQEAVLRVRATVCIAL
jgi:predicted Zn-dependent protease